jgi:hypothetical protein
MSPRKSLVVTYKYFDHFSFLDESILPKLKRLTIGNYGIMKFLVESAQEGYSFVSDGWGRTEADELNIDWGYFRLRRCICIAFVKN